MVCNRSAVNLSVLKQNQGKHPISISAPMIDSFIVDITIKMHSPSIIKSPAILIMEMCKRGEQLPFYK